MAHQLEVLELLYDLNKIEKRIIVMVLHDLNFASIFTDYMIALKDGKIVCSGTPFEVITKKHLVDIFNINAEICTDPNTKKPICLTYNLIK